MDNSSRLIFCPFTLRAATLFFLVFVLSVFPRPLHAGEIVILSPPENSVIYARAPSTHLVVKLSSRNDVKRLKVKKGDKLLYEAFKVDASKKDYYVAHFRLPLEPGYNVFTLEPGSRQLKIKYNPLKSLLAANFDGPRVYLLHRTAVVPKVCMDCHNEKSAPGIGGVKPMNGSFSPLCYSCHKAMIVESIWLHSPAANVQCRSCHQPGGKNAKVAIPGGKVDKLCFRCHVNKAKWPKMKHVHGPVGTGDCTVCHNPHGDQFESQLWAPGERELCLSCHIDKRMFVKGGPVPYTHGIMQGVGCTACHSPHATENRFQLYKPINDLCSGCHPSIADKGDHPIKGHPVSGVKDPRRPDRELVCTGCHDPHGSEYRYMLIGNHLGNRVCRKCHKSR